MKIQTMAKVIVLQILHLMVYVLTFALPKSERAATAEPPTFVEAEYHMRKGVERPISNHISFVLGRMSPLACAHKIDKLPITK